MNRTQLHNPTQADQATLEQAVRLLVGSIGKDADPVSAVRSVFSTICMNDTNANCDVAMTLRALDDAAFAIQNEAHQLWDAYTDAAFELQDNPEILSHLRGKGAGHSEVPASLAALPPQCVSHVVRRHDRSKWMGKLNSPEVAIASENADAASNCLVVEQAIEDARPLPQVFVGNELATEEVEKTVKYGFVILPNGKLGTREIGGES
jgi:hypothetical protein